MPDRLLLDWIDPLEDPEAAPRLRERIAALDEWIDYSLDHAAPAAADMLHAKRTYQRALRIAEAVGGDKYALAADLIHDLKDNR